MEVNVSVACMTVWFYYRTSTSLTTHKLTQFRIRHRIVGIFYLIHSFCRFLMTQRLRSDFCSGSGCAQRECEKCMHVTGDTLFTSIDYGVNYSRETFLRVLFALRSADGWMDGRVKQEKTRFQPYTTMRRPSQLSLNICMYRVHRRPIENSHSIQSSFVVASRRCELNAAHAKKLKEKTAASATTATLADSSSTSTCPSDHNINCGERMVVSHRIIKTQLTTRYSPQTRIRMQLCSSHCYWYPHTPHYAQHNAHISMCSVCVRLTSLPLYLFLFFCYRNKTTIRPTVSRLLNRTFPVALCVKHTGKSKNKRRMKIEKHADGSISKSKHSQLASVSFTIISTDRCRHRCSRYTSLSDSTVSAVSELDTFRIDDSGYSYTATTGWKRWTRTWKCKRTPKPK